MGIADYLAEGDYNATCSMCGSKFKASMLTRNWQGMYRCPEHNEERQPQDYVRAIADVQTPEWTQPPTDTFVIFCDPAGTTALVDVGCVDCMVVDFISPIYTDAQQEVN